MKRSYIVGGGVCLLILILAAVFFYFPEKSSELAVDSDTVTRKGNVQADLVPIGHARDGEHLGNFFIDTAGAIFEKRYNGDILPEPVGEMVGDTIGLYIDETNEFTLIIDDTEIHNWSTAGWGDKHFVSYNSEKYGRVDLYTSLAGPYGIYEPVDSVRYVCDGPFMQHRDRQTGVLSDSPYTNCDTNGVDYLEQFEFTAAGSGLATGGEYCEAWSKLYARNIDGQDVFFVYRNDALFHPNENCLDPELGGFNTYNSSTAHVLDRLNGSSEFNDVIEYVDTIVRDVVIVGL